ncbi:MAG: immune inhibitor A [Acidobacteriota bacterium]|nr:immune inhibitor A [Acidobacteriota bacterium]
MMVTTFKRTEKEISQTRSPIYSIEMIGRPPELRASSILPICALILAALLLAAARPATTHAVRLGTGPYAPEAPSGNHIKEVIPERFQKKYEKWKAEYLSTKVGREQWDRYAHNSNFTLTITMSEEAGRGAGTDQYRWNDNGQLVAATITLGEQADEGFPSPFNYPVTSSLAHTEPFPPISGSLLAATKFAHEFGHVIQVGTADARLFQLQNKLIPVYNHILLSNGRNAQDPKLLELAKQMKGTPVEIGQDRELWAEANALSFLRERCPEDGEYKSVFKAIRSAVESYAKAHVDRFR